MSNDPKDKVSTTSWAMASIGGGGALVGYNAFLLVNRKTNREHQLHLPSGGFQFSLGASGGSPSYTLFETSKAVNFSNFHGVGARITTANMGLIWGYSLAYLTLWEDAAYVSNTLAYIKMGGGGPMLPGGAVGHGVTIISYGSGTPSGDVPMVLELEEDFGPPGPRLAFFKSAPSEPPLIRIPDDVLFDFDKHDIKPEAKESLLEIADMLNNRTKLPVQIEGHTDSKGDDAYNKKLSLKRANAIKDWFIQNKVYKADDFDTIGQGESNPVQPNQKPDGSDNPEGRKQNRRVEIKFSRHFPEHF
jgi:outer membrane protein OmpA-like peptidoglycan-associated protein